MSEFIALLAIPVVVLAAWIAVAATKTARHAERERQRIACEIFFAEWQLRQLTRAGMKQLFDEARRHQRHRAG